MTDSLREKLVAVIGAITPAIPFSLSEEEIGDYPYATYEMTTVPTYAKDRVVRITGSTAIYIVSKIFSEADGIRSRIEAALASNMNDGQYGSVLTSTLKECTEGIWTITLNYNVYQKS